MLEDFLATEILPVRIFQPSGDDDFIAEVVKMFEVMESNQQANGQPGSSNLFSVKGAQLVFKDLPIDGRRKLI